MYKIIGIISLIFLLIDCNAEESVKSSANSPKEHKVKLGGQDDFDLLLGAQKRKELQSISKINDASYISNIYRRGPFLIYDCERGYYACVNKDGFNYCKDIRNDSRKKRYRILSCAPLKKFEVKKDCIAVQKKLVDYPVNKFFCFSEKILEEFD